MSISPEKDLHSVYIDGEMPEEFVAQYKSSLEGNEKARKDFERMAALHQIFQEDAASRTADRTFSDESFERLQTKLRYSRTVKTNQKSYIVPFVKYASSFAAAAAVFAVIFIPLHNNALSEARMGEVAAIEITKDNKIKPVSEKQIVIDGSLNADHLSTGIAVAAAEKKSAGVKENMEKAAEDETVPAVEQKTIQASAFVSNGGSGNSYERGARRGFNRPGRSYMVPPVDPFRPDFSERSMIISVPKIEEMGNNSEIIQSEQQ